MSSLSPPLSMSHPDLYLDGDMDENPATRSAALQSLTGVRIEEDEHRAASAAGPETAAGSGSGPGAAPDLGSGTGSGGGKGPSPGIGLGSGTAPEKKRRRPALSCEQCRRRKIRCDRGLPCANCVKSKITPCTYAPTHIPASRIKKATSQAQDHGSDRAPSAIPIRSAPLVADSGVSASEHIRQGPLGGFYGSRSGSSIHSSTVGSTSDHSTVDALVARVRQLEQQLENNVHISRNTDDTLVPNEEEESSAPMKGTISKTRFFGQSHWMNGAHMFPDLLSVLNQAEARRLEPYSMFVKCKTLGRAIKENRFKPITTNQLGQAVPQRHLADQLVDAYFQSFEGGIRILHGPTFRVEYERYWQNPSAASDVFVIQLQLCMAIGATLHDDLFSLRSQATQWVHEAQVWLLLPPEKSRMTIAGIQIMCMMIIAKATCAIGQDLTWVTTGSLVRQAMYMGLHRDPKHLANMSVYRAEIRRRLWATILELNLQSSYDAGGPPLISAKHYDTLPPANLNDDELTDEPENKVPPTNSNGLTDMSAQLALFKSLPLRLSIIKHINEFRSRESYPETLRFNSELTKACRSMNETLASLTQAQKRINRTILTSFHSSLIQLFLYRCFISLHQPLLARANDDPTFYYSRKVSLDCCLKMAQICGLSSPQYTPSPPGPAEPAAMFARLITNGAGVFRVVPTQGLLSIALELIKKKEEQRDSLMSIPSMGNSELRLTLDAALAWTERRIRSGETNIKGHCFTAACIAMADAIEMNLSKEETDQTIINTGANISNKCWEIMKEVAQREGVPVVEEPEVPADVAGVENMDSFMDLTFDWMGDIGWDGGMWSRNLGGQTNLIPQFENVQF